MLRPSLSRPLLLLLLFTTTVQGWTFVWRNSTGANVAHENKPATCVRIYHEKDLEFSWDPEGAWCLKIWREAECKNLIGFECEHTKWRKDASRNLSAYDVYRMPEDAREKFITTTSEVSSSASETTMTATSDEATTTSAGDATTRTTMTAARAGGTGARSSTSTSTATGDADSDDGGGALSGGAIAGIAVGAVAGVVVLAAGFFLWGRRRPRSGGEAGAGIASDTGPQSTHPDPRSGNLPGAASGYAYGPTGSSNGPQMTEAPTLVASSDSATQYAPDAHVYRPPGTGLPVELPGEMGGVELSNSRQLMEMDGEGYVKRSNSIAKE